jgi:hypothetical protein
MAEPVDSSASSPEERATLQPSKQPDPTKLAGGSENLTDQRERPPNATKPNVERDGARKKFFLTKWPWTLITLISAIGALGSYCFNLIVGEPGIAWWQESPAQPPFELHVRPGETYGRIGLRNLTRKVFKNVGVQLQVSRGEFARGSFTPDARDIVPASESRVMSVLETGPSNARYSLVQHVERFDPDRTWFFDYSGIGLAEVTAALTEGVTREQFLELKGNSKPPEIKDAQPLELHRWTCKDDIFEWRLWIPLVCLASCVVGAVVLFVTWIKQKQQ